MRALPGRTWHDVMTYCANQWLSSFTYTAIRDRLNLENALPAGPAGAGGPAAPAGAGRRTRSVKMTASSEGIQVVARVNRTQKIGELLHVTPQATAATMPLPTARRGAKKGRGKDEPVARLRVLDAAGKSLGEYSVTMIPDACRDPGEDDTATVDALIPKLAGAAQIELLLDDRVLDTFAPSATVAAPRGVAVSRRATERRATRGAGLAAETAAESLDPVISWNAPAAVRGTRGAAKALAGPGGTAVYTVQISTDAGQTWQTIGFNLQDPEVAIDHNLLGESDKVRVRITSTNGFESSTTEKEFKVGDLT